MKWFKKNTSKEPDPFSLDWDRITTDFDNGSESVHVINADLANNHTVNLTKSLIVNKYNYYNHNLFSEFITKK